MTISATCLSNIDLSRLEKAGNSIYNDEIRQYLATHITAQFASEKNYSDMHCIEEFVSEMRQWINSSKENKIIGLKDFNHGFVSLGVTQALDQFHYDILLSNRKLRMFRGEYPYSRDVHPFSFESDFIDDRPLQRGDALILSCPFSGTGRRHPEMDKTLDECLKLEIPVFLDFAWFGTCSGLHVDLSHRAISQVAFSLTKGLTCGNYRSGVCFIRNDFFTGNKTNRLRLQQEWNHSIHLNLRIGLLLMKSFGPDTQYLKYGKAQLAICETLQLEPSLCVHIATSKEEKWKDFDRDGIGARINLRQVIKKLLIQKRDLNND
jgi:hypothetical protein